MKQRIEILSLEPKKDPITQKSGSSLVLTYKKDNGIPEAIEFDCTYRAALDMFWIDSPSDIVWRKFDVEMEDSNGRRIIKTITTVDDRQIPYAEFEELKKNVRELLEIIKKKPENQQNQQNKQNPPQEQKSNQPQQ